MASDIEWRNWRNWRCEGTFIFDYMWQGNHKCVVQCLRRHLQVVAGWVKSSEPWATATAPPVKLPNKAPTRKKTDPTYAWAGTTSSLQKVPKPEHLAEPIRSNRTAIGSLCPFRGGLLSQGPSFVFVRGVFPNAGNDDSHSAPHTGVCCAPLALGRTCECTIPGGQSQRATRTGCGKRARDLQWQFPFVRLGTDDQVNTQNICVRPELRRDAVEFGARFLPVP